LAGSADRARRTAQQGSVRAAGLLHNSPQLNGDALEPPSDSTQIQPHNTKTRQERPTVATRNLNRNHRSAGHLCQLAACRASGEIGTEALAVLAERVVGNTLRDRGQARRRRPGRAARDSAAIVR
jgi:hypothetical protein